MDRDRWILSYRPQRNTPDPSRPYAFFVEDERSATGEIVPTATIFLTNRECPWRCLMCDLWKNTLTETVQPGEIPAQIDYALEKLPPSRQIKVYNSGSFFDPHAIPTQDYRQIADQVSTFERVIVESHPALIGESCYRFKDLLSNCLEVAVGLETVHPEILATLNKQMTLDQFAESAGRLRTEDIDLRVFILVELPFMKAGESLEWAKRSLGFAFDCGASAATLIPTRGGNGAIEELALAGDFRSPHLATLEATAEYGVALGRGRVFADLWDTSHIKTCAACDDLRIARLCWMNLYQAVPNAIHCQICGGGTES